MENCRPGLTEKELTDAEKAFAEIRMQKSLRIAEHLSTKLITAAEKYIVANSCIGTNVGGEK